MQVVKTCIRLKHILHMKRKSILTALALLCAAVLLGSYYVIAASAPRESEVRSFPGAEGYGAASVGGRGGQVIYVTTLDDYDPETEAPIEGSLRWALDQKGPRTILFRVSGDICTKTPIKVTEPYVTIAGQTSPGGVCVRDCEFVVNTHDVIVRHMRFRSGEAMKAEYDSFQFVDSYNCILDHCSMSWSTDEVLSATEGTSFHNATFQWCIISEGLAQSFHPKGEHSMGSLLSGDGGLTIHHCLYANNGNRNPRSHYLVMDYRNNVVYNWRSQICYTRAAPSFINMADNYFKPGPDTPAARETLAFSPGDDMAAIYLSGNEVYRHPEAAANNNILVDMPRNAPASMFEAIIAATPFDMPEVKTTTASIAYRQVLEMAGATMPRRDATDVRVVDGVRYGTGRIIDSPDQVGGYPALTPLAAAPEDGDGDGMPDEWEKRHGLDPSDPSDGRADRDGDGYTNLEEYLNGTDPGEREADAVYDSASILAKCKTAIDMLVKKDLAYKEEQRRMEQAREDHKQALMKSTRADFSAAPAAAEKRVTLTLNSGPSIDLVLIPAGSFLMGATVTEGGEPQEYPQHRVNISKPFYMAVTKVSTAQYCSVMGADSRKLTKANASEPAPTVTWFEACDFCEVLSAATGLKFRLPTEAEWEYACRAGTQTFFSTGNTITSAQANFNAAQATDFNPAGVSRGSHTAVDMFPPNAWGLYDMHGNESEFCLDKAFRQYTAEEVTDPLCNDPSSTRYVIRGGKAASKAFYVRSAYRYSYTPDVGFSFRFVVEMPS